MQTPGPGTGTGTDMSQGGCGGRYPPVSGKRYDLWAVLPLADGFLVVLVPFLPSRIFRIS